MLSLVHPDGPDPDSDRDYRDREQIKKVKGLYLNSIALLLLLLPRAKARSFCFIQCIRTAGTECWCCITTPQEKLDRPI